jgi:hypothetical protein
MVGARHLEDVYFRIADNPGVSESEDAKAFTNTNLIRIPQKQR